MGIRRNSLPVKTLSSDKRDIMKRTIIQAIALGMFVFLMLQAANAATETESIESMFNVVFLFRLVLGVLVAMLWFYIRSITVRVGENDKTIGEIGRQLVRYDGLSVSLNKLAEAVTSLQNQINKDFPSKEETREYRVEMQLKLAEIKQDVKSGDAVITERLNALADNRFRQTQQNAFIAKGNRDLSHDEE